MALSMCSVYHFYSHLYDIRLLGVLSFILKLIRLLLSFLRLYHHPSIDRNRIHNLPVVAIVLQSQLYNLPILQYYHRDSKNEDLYDMLQELRMNLISIILGRHVGKLWIYATTTLWMFIRNLWTLSYRWWREVSIYGIAPWYQRFLLQCLSWWLFHFWNKCMK